MRAYYVLADSATIFKVKLPAILVHYVTMILCPAKIRPAFFIFEQTYHFSNCREIRPQTPSAILSSFYIHNDNKIE
jgi:hypothetical protein